jgi:hypothetical protein
MENPYWEFFSGMRFFSHSLPIDAPRMTRWRNRPGASGAEEILKATLQTALKVVAVRPPGVGSLDSRVGNQRRDKASLSCSSMTCMR